MQNRSSAVMQQRSEPDDSLDDFPTPPWGGRALCEYLRGAGLLTEDMTCWEPAANRGFLRRGLVDYFRYVAASDVHDYGSGFSIEDFLFPGEPPVTGVDWIITNPPFRLADQFARRALSLAPNVALFVRSAFLEGAARHRELFLPNRPAIVMQYVERIPLVRGRVDQEAASATAYSWVIWSAQREGACVFDWIPPCRKRLEKAGDYD